MEHSQQQKLLLKDPSIISHGTTYPKSLSWYKPSWIQKYVTGWRCGVLSCASWSLVAFIINITIFLWAEAKNGFPGLDDGDGKHTIYEGDCEMTRKINIGVHLLINALSTILLGASNYCMQCMSAPTRREVDSAHREGKWLDIGVQSIRNIFFINKKRALFYLALALSSLPLHLFYNSTVFSSIAVTNYYIYSANEAFTDPSSKNYTLLDDPCFGHSWELDCTVDGHCRYSSEKVCTAKALLNRTFEQSKSGRFERLDKSACIDAYSIPFQTNRASLILVVPNTTAGFDPKIPTIRYEHEEPINNQDSGNCNKGPFSWICPPQKCGDQCQFNVGATKKDIVNWKPFSTEVLYCLSEPIEQHCRLLYSTHLATMVIILNALKVAMMLYIALGIREAPLITMGDAVASFLDVRDISTGGMCLASRKDIRRSQKIGSTWPIVAKEYSSTRHPRAQSSSRARWITTLTIFSIAIAVVIGLLVWGIQRMNGPNGIDTILSLGLGAINPVTFISWEIPSKGSIGLISNVLVANFPQVVLSFLYFAYNGMFTCMSLASEWSRFALHRKGLRVSGIPKGDQRSKYFLQLPYRFAVPLMVLSGTLHWLVSESIFLVTVDGYVRTRDGNGVRASYFDFMTCGYSPIAMIAVIVVGVIMVAAAIVTSRFKLKSGMPIAGSCSAAISAACHPWEEVENREMAISKLRWGSLANEGEIGHCSFTSEEVTQPEDGKLYAGL